MLWETGFKLMKYRVIERKLIFVKYLQKCDESSLSNQVHMEQERLKFPGLLKECQQLAKQFQIEHFLIDKEVSQAEFKRIVKNTINLENENEMKQMMKKSIKCYEIKKESFGLKPYFRELNVTQIRTKFRAKAKMIQVKFNFKNDGKNSTENWVCDSCERSAIESQSHIMWCEAYAHLRIGKDISCDKDLIQYLNNVMNIRQELKLQR